jgi:hypothetical protein
VTPVRDTGRLHRSFAAVESSYVRDLGRRELRRPRAASPAAGRRHRTAGERLDGVHRRARDGRSVHA